MKDPRVDNGLLLDQRHPADLAPLSLDRAEALCIEAYFSLQSPLAESTQVLAAQWALRDRMDAFDAFDAGTTAGLNTKGYFGAAFDGRHVYFAPQFNGDERHGNVLRYDTQAPFATQDSWQAYDAGATGGLVAKGYYGAVHAAPYIYYVPRTDGEHFHTRLLRYDTRLSFEAASAWQAHDIGYPISYQSAAYDGRFIYLVPGYDQEEGACGKVLRYDTRADLADPAAYTLYDAGRTDGLGSVCYDGAVFDGRYVFFAPLNDQGIVLRCDTRADFSHPKAWAAYDASLTGGLEMGMCVGALFDGRYVYFTPYSGTSAVRYDTQANFHDPSAWQARSIAAVSGLDTRGYDGALFDGRYLYYIPFWDGNDSRSGFHNTWLRYDTLGPYDDDRAWLAVDASALTQHPGGFNGGAFDGRYLYAAPWREDPPPGDEAAYTPHGKVLRYDTAAEGSIFALKACECGHNGGLGAALPGPAFYLQTSAGLYGVRANRALTAGKHHMAATWTQGELRFYLDGELVDQTRTTGFLTGNAPLGVGHYAGGGARFDGTLDRLLVRTQASNAAYLAEAARVYLTS